ncbi:MAG: RraA family protein [Euryarchaeota archaeon]|nr:RraA family protein [Euryarchaeota archaeon]
MSKKDKISPESLLKKFSSKTTDLDFLKVDIKTPQISDALKQLSCLNGVISGVKPLNDAKIVGKAVTVKTLADDWGTVVNAIDIAKKGEVIVICSETDGHALWGELTSETAQKKKIAGTVVYGASRDVAAIRKLNYPVFSKSIIPNAGDPKGEGEINVTINCGGVTVNPQDMIIGDDCGVVVVPKKLFREVLKKAFNIKKREKEIIRKIKDGMSLSEILGLKILND